MELFQLHPEFFWLSIIAGVDLISLGLISYYKGRQVLMAQLERRAEIERKRPGYGGRPPSENDTPSGLRGQKPLR